MRSIIFELSILNYYIFETADVIFSLIFFHFFKKIHFLENPQFKNFRIIFSHISLNLQGFSLFFPIQKSQTLLSIFQTKEKFYSEQVYFYIFSKRGKVFFT